MLHVYVFNDNLLAFYTAKRNLSVVVVVVSGHYHPACISHLNKGNVSSPACAAIDSGQTFPF